MQDGTTLLAGGTKPITENPPKEEPVKQTIDSDQKVDDLFPGAPKDQNSDESGNSDEPKDGITKEVEELLTGTSDEGDSKDNETKPDDKETQSKKDEETKSDDDKSKTSQVPDKYELKGLDGSVLDTEQIQAFTPIAKEIGLSNESAQKIVTLYEKMGEEQSNLIEKQTQTWKTELLKDKDKVNEVKAALVRFASSEDLKFLRDNPYANYHPNIVNILSGIGKYLAERKPTEGKGASGEEQDAADILKLDEPQG